MRSRKSIISLLCFAILLNISCKDGVERTSPKMSKSMLALKGYKFTEPEFFRGLEADNPLVVGGVLEAGINPNAKNDKGETALTYSLQNVESEKIINALVSAADINLRDDLGNSPIHLAFWSENEKIIDLFLKKNADVNITGQRRQAKNISALFAMIIKKRADLVRKLLENGADPNIADSAGSLPLAEASFQRTANPKIVEMLLEHGAKVNKTEKNGTTPLIYAASNGDITSETRVKIVKLLLKSGADKSIKNNEGENALMWAKKLKYDKVVEILK